ncbi:hypothetical protein HPP92_002399 [Vanilla planifolia]|uniref:AIG1-type G domain-containing protein n=1 Tax=Vanilla planifolia TaxID=51239 RepID=A0A835VHX7_VANPL|nr:hypothetical protein HPP92_002399 [Vanilla planifolia]
MENRNGIVCETTPEVEDCMLQMEMAPVDSADSQFTGCRMIDMEENEIFQDTVADAGNLHAPQHFDVYRLKDVSLSKVESRVVPDEVDGDLSLTQETEGAPLVVELNHQKLEEVPSLAEVGAEVTSVSQAKDVGYLQLETAVADEAVCPKGLIKGVCRLVSAINMYNDHGGAEGLVMGVAEPEQYSLNGGQCNEVNIEGNEKRHTIFPHEMKGATEESLCASQAEDCEVTRESRLNGEELTFGTLGACSVTMDEGEMVSDSTNEDVGSNKSENGGLIREEASFPKEGHVDFFKCEEESNNHEVEVINDIREDNGMIEVKDSLLTKEELKHFGKANESDSFKQSDSGQPSESNFALRVGAAKETVLVEDLGELSTMDDDENDAIRKHVPTSSASCPEPSAAPSFQSRPAGLGSSVPLLEPAARSVQQPRANGSLSQQQTQTSESSLADDAEGSDEIREKLQMIRVKFLRLAHRLGQTPHNVVVAQVLYRLGLAEQLRRNTNRPGVFSFDRASVMAEQLEASGQDPLDFSCTIMVIGKSGVGKSATINSIFNDAKLHTDAFELTTTTVQNVVGTVHGIKVRVIDTPGLSSSSSDQRYNEKILFSIKRFIGKTPPDIVLYFDRLDMQSRDYGDVPLLRSITNVFGSSIWFNAIVVLTHAASAPPDGPNGTPLSYEMFVTQRSHVVQQAIRQAAGDVRLMNPVSLVENHSACRMNRAGQRVLPNGQVWKPQLLLLSFASKILQEANILLKLDDSPPGKQVGSRTRVPPLPFFLSSLLQSRSQVKLPDEQMGDEDNIFEDLDEASDVDDGSDYDELPPFKTLTRAQLAKLSKAQKKAYYEELDYREKLFFKKQLKEEKKRLKLLKEMAKSVNNAPNDHGSENAEGESVGPASVPVPMPDLVLPNSFDSDYPSHRYRFLDSSNRWLVRPVLETQGWDHDVGYEGLNVERLFAVKDHIPLSISGQLTKDKKDCTLQMEVASSIKHTDNTATSLGLDLQSIGKDMAYTLRSETKFKSFRCNNTAAGLSVSILGDTVSAGLKIEDKLVVNKMLKVLIGGGAMTGRGDAAYGGRLEATLRDKDYPIGQNLSTIALSIVDWHGDLALGCNIQTQHPLGRRTNVVCHGNLSNKGSGQVGIRLNTSDQLQIAFLALLPIFKGVIRMLPAM